MNVLRRVLISAAFATCWFLNTWAALGERRTAYFLRNNPALVIVPQVIGCQILVIVAILLAWEIARRTQRHLAFDIFFLAASLVPAGIGAAAAERLLPHGIPASVEAHLAPAVVLLSAVPLIGLALWRPRASARWLRSIFLWSWPVLGIILVRAGTVTLFRYRSADYASLRTAARLPRPIRRNRVVWIIFDELSQTVAFDHRPASLSLPNLEALREQSFYATAAYAPAGATLLSMPALILGETVIRAEPDGPADLRLEIPEQSGWIHWGSALNVFDDARRLGFNTALAGWYHPYGRLLNRSLTECYWTADSIEPGVEEPLHKSLSHRASLQFSNLPLVGRIPPLSPRNYQRRVRIRDFDLLMKRSIELVADPAIGLVLLHLPVPHPPGIYDRREQRVDAPNSRGYLDNVALADRALGDLRRAIDAAGLADRTAIILSADHGWRTALWRPFPEWSAEEETFASAETMGVPFIVKMPGISRRLEHLQPFDTVITRKLIGAILEGQITDPRDIPKLLQR